VIAQASRQVKRLALATAGSFPDLVAPPGSGATITVWEQQNIPTDVATLALAVRSSHDSAANGVTFEVSFDAGASWDAVQAGSSYVAAGGMVVLTAPRVGTHMRVRYANSANVLTIWRGEMRLRFVQ
jgi:hypothetical protein